MFRIPFPEILNSVSKPGAIVAHLGNLLIIHPLNQMLLLALFAPRVYHAELNPHDDVTDDGKCYHGHGHGVAFYEARALFCGVQLLILAWGGFFSFFFLWTFPR